MSLGIKRKLAVVTAFMSDPEVLILDEPTSGLDPVMQEAFVDFLKEEKGRGRTILLSSHVFSEVDATCDRIAIIKDGRLVSTFLVNDLKHASKKFYRVYFASSFDYGRFMAQASNLPYLSILESAPDKSMVYLSTEDKDINQVIALLASYRIANFSNEKETLEDYFMKFYKEDRSFAGAL
jgi:ABC-2 type transport system ATP-binding protein